MDINLIRVAQLNEKSPSFAKWVSPILEKYEDR